MRTTRFSLHHLGYFCAVVSVLYTGIVTVLVMVRNPVCPSRQYVLNTNEHQQIPQVYPVTASSMNYTILLAGVFAILCLGMWLFDARKSYRPPTFEQFVVNVAPPEDRDTFMEGDKSLNSPGLE